MNTERVQQMVDALGSRLRRSVAVDDHMLKLVAVGEDYGDSDPARMWSLLHRRTRPEDVDYPSLRTAVGPTWIEPNEELGLMARVCVPIRCEGDLLGLLWIIDRERRLTPEQIEDAVATAEAIGVLLRQRMMISDRDTTLAAYLLDELLSADPDRSAQAAGDLRQYGFVADDSHLAVIVVEAVGAEPAPAALVDVVQRAGRTVAPGGWLASVSGRRATVLLSGPRPVEEGTRAAAGRLNGLLCGRKGTWWIGVGGPAQGLSGAATSRHQAMGSISVGRRLHRSDPGPEGCAVVSWSELGPYRLIGRLPPGILGEDGLPPGLFTLLRSGDAGHLLTTVEAFLDCAGDKQRTARELDIHRTTLYYRLDRIEAITGLSLHDGADRLMLHLAVKLHRLGGAGLGPGLGVAPPVPGFRHDDG